jgi:hypothetical protein
VVVVRKTFVLLLAILFALLFSGCEALLSVVKPEVKIELPPEA